MKKKLLCGLILLSSLCVLSACGKKASSAAASSEAVPTVTEAPASSSVQGDCTEAMQPLLDAIEAGSLQPSFGIHTAGLLSLKGGSIHGDYEVEGEVHAEQGENHSGLLLSSVTFSGIDDSTTYMSFADGYYYEDGPDGRKKVEKTPEDVLSVISDATSLVRDGAAFIDEAEITQDGENTVYRYDLPDFLAERYLKELVKRAGKESDLGGVRIDIEEAHLVSVVGPDGFLLSQEADLIGSLHKMIFAIPAEFTLTADFTVPDTEEPQPVTW